jgi:hypothetical protein
MGRYEIVILNLRRGEWKVIVKGVCMKIDVSMGKFKQETHQTRILVY